MLNLLSLFLILSPPTNASVECASIDHIDAYASMQLHKCIIVLCCASCLGTFFAMSLRVRQYVRACIYVCEEFNDRLTVGEWGADQERVYEMRI